MDRRSRFLCLVLALWTVSSRPSASFHAGSYDPGDSQRAKDQQSLATAARKFVAAGDYSRAEALYERAYQQALLRGDRKSIIGYLSAVANCRMFLFHYRGALSAYLDAKELARSSGDRSGLGAVLLNLSNLYLQTGDPDSALEAAEEARATVTELPGLNYRAQLMLQLGRLHQDAGDDQAEPMLEAGIEAARSQSDAPLEAKAWSLLGDQRLLRGRLSAAERAIDESFRLRVLRAPQDKGYSYGQLGALKLAQGNLDQAERLTSTAIRAGKRAGTAYAEYRLVHQLGQIKRARHDTQGALEDFKKAMRLASAWRRETLPGISPRDASAEALQRKIFESYIETAASEALQTGNLDRMREGLFALESNRFASLREELAQPQMFPRQYWALLEQLKAEQTRNLRRASGDTAEAKRLRFKIAEMEAELELSGKEKVSSAGENFRSQTSLIHFQEGLGQSDLLLSFHLGQSDSYLWAMSRGSLTLHRLPPAEQLRRQVQDFGEAVREGRAGANQDSAQLYVELFSGLSRQEITKERWLLSLEDALFELPFSALITGRKDGKVTYLIEQHSIQIVPGAAPLGHTAIAFGNEVQPWFLGVGDPIYNTADQRWHSPTGPRFGSLLFTDSMDGRGQYNRLIGSATEVQSSARSWSTGSGTSVLLTGSDARLSTFLSSLERNPAVIHLATHVFSHSGRNRGDAFIAFGLGSGSQAELLSTAEVAALHVPGSLVVMSGCETGRGETRAGVGLIGLTRAWLLAGADAVMSTEWSVKDSNGELFTSFYRNLTRLPAAEALRRSQMEMIASGTWRATPAFWASYQITGGVR